MSDITGNFSTSDVQLLQSVTGIEEEKIAETNTRVLKLYLLLNSTHFLVKSAKRVKTPLKRRVLSGMFYQ